MTFAHNLKNDRLLRALLNQPVDRTPVWLMRQAGRYLPEYRQLRKQAGSFMQLCKTPDLASEVTLQPLQRFDLDAAILFSDILTIPDAMGLGLYFEEGFGPKFKRTVRTNREISKLGVPDPEVELSYVLETIRILRKEIAGAVPLIGFCGSPWTIACYAVEGRSNKDFPHIKAMLESSPNELHKLLDILSNAVTLHLNAQIKAGVQAVMLFDSWGGMLDFENYQTFSLYYLQRIISGLIRENEGRRVPCILFARGCHKSLEQMAGSGCDALGLDWQISLSEARSRVGAKVALQGNLNPSILKLQPEKIRSSVSDVLAEYGCGSGHVFNLGHGVTPDILPEHVGVLVDAVHEMSCKYHKGE